MDPEMFLASIDDIIAGKVDCPFPIEVIPNRMGINLCSVDSIVWKKESDGQLIFVAINFLPDTSKDIGEVPTKTHSVDVRQIQCTVHKCPIDLDIITKQMKQPKCSIKSVDWIKRPDEQLVQVTLNFFTDYSCSADDYEDKE